MFYVFTLFYILLQDSRFGGDVSFVRLMELMNGITRENIKCCVAIVAMDGQMNM